MYGWKGCFLYVYLFLLSSKRKEWAMLVVNCQWGLARPALVDYQKPTLLMDLDIGGSRSGYMVIFFIFLGLFWVILRPRFFENAAISSLTPRSILWQGDQSKNGACLSILITFVIFFLWRVILVILSTYWAPVEAWKLWNIAISYFTNDLLKDLK